MTFDNMLFTIQDVTPFLLVPTACYLMDLPLPDHAEGAVIYQIFEDPDFKQKEIQQLREMLAEMESRLT